MHPSVMAWVASRVADHQLAELETLEVGSFNVNGTARILFTGPYIGVDSRHGPNVDQVASAADLPFPDGRFQVVVCTEMLEHDPTFWLSVPEMTRVLQPGGWLLLTARGIGFPEHDFPSDYWRFTPAAFEHLFTTSGLQTVEVIPDRDPHSPGVFGLARKEV